MTAMLKSSPGGDLFGTVRCYPLLMFKVTFLSDPGYETLFQSAIHPLLSCQVSLHRIAQILRRCRQQYIWASRGQATNQKWHHLSSLHQVGLSPPLMVSLFLPSVPIQHLDTSPFNGWVNANASCMLSWCVSNQLLTSPFSVFLFFFLKHGTLWGWRSVRQVMQRGRGQCQAPSAFVWEH